MSSKVRKPPRNNRESACDGNGIESLYLQFLKQFYEKGDRRKTQDLAARVENALAASPDYAGSIREEEIRSLIAESRGDFAQAARSREAEIRKILQLHTLSVNTPGWEYVARQYGFSDVSDRLDLLAILYDELGDLDRAIATLHESKRYCESHGIPFDGRDLLDELEQARDAAVEGHPDHVVAREQIDDAACKHKEKHHEWHHESDCKLDADSACQF
jgi:hypothetical protein